MFEPNFRFPVKCPICRTEGLTSVPMGQVAEALVKNEPISLRAVCHEVVWTATESETDQIREYFAEVWVADGKTRK